MLLAGWVGAAAASLCTGGGALGAGQRGTHLAKKGSAGGFLLLITGEKEWPSIWSRERHDLVSCVLGHLSQVVMSLLSRVLQATVGLGHGHDFQEQEADWLTWVSW